MQREPSKIPYCNLPSNLWQNLYAGLHNFHKRMSEYIKRTQRETCMKRFLSIFSNTNWLIDWMAFYAAFNGISVTSAHIIHVFPVGFTSARLWSSIQKISTHGNSVGCLTTCMLNMQWLARYHVSWRCTYLPLAIAELIWSLKKCE